MLDSPPSADKPSRYHIRVQGHLDATWSEWLDGLSITHTPGQTTTLSGVVIDQAALYGLLMRLRDLGLTLLAVECDPQPPFDTDFASKKG